MKLTILTLSLTVTFCVPAVWGQKYTKQGVNPAGPSLDFRTRHIQQHSMTKRASAPPPAPGVVQVHLEPSTGSLVAFFIPTSTIPSGSMIQGSITLLDDNSAINFTGFQLSQAYQPGQAIFLPAFSNFGDVYFNQGASFDYTVQVVPPSGATTQADGFVLVGESYQFTDLPMVEPIITSISQSINGSKDVILAIKGLYTGDPALVVLSDLFANYVVPASAITVSATEIDVDMSKIVGFNLSFLDEVLVTVSEDGLGDTTVFRYVPPQNGTYNPAPTQ